MTDTLKYNRLTVIGSTTRPVPRGGVETLWVCRCECGTEITYSPSRVRRGAVKSCGCLGRERIHGMSGKNKPVAERVRMYGVWKGMLSRCRCTGCSSYPNYGGRGIKVCPEWTSFPAFRAFILTLLPPGATDIPKGLDLDRIDNDGDYEPSNVRFVTRSRNLSNRRCNVNVTIDGVTKTRREWCRQYGLTETCVRYRMKKLGWDAARAITTPLMPREQRRAYGFAVAARDEALQPAEGE